MSFNTSRYYSASEAKASPARRAEFLDFTVSNFLSEVALTNSTKSFERMIRTTYDIREWFSVEISLNLAVDYYNHLEPYTIWEHRSIVSWDNPMIEIVPSTQTHLAYREVKSIKTVTYQVSFCTRIIRGNRHACKPTDKLSVIEKRHHHFGKAYREFVCYLYDCC